jgi:peptidyl-prolyl cis-trans isomerase SurA
MKRPFAAALAASLMSMAVALHAQDTTFAIPTGGRQIPVDRIVAVAGKEAILQTDVEERFAQTMAQMQAAGRQPPQDSASRAELRRQILDNLVNEALLVQRAKELNIEVTDADVAQSVDRYMQRARQQFASEEEFRGELRRTGFGSPEEFRRWYSDAEKRRAYQERLVGQLRQEGKLPPVPVTDEDVRRYFEANREQLPPTPATVAFRQIIILPRPDSAARTAARAKAESLLVEIRRGGDFAQIARRESDDPGSKEVGGDLGWQRRGGGLVPEFERVMVALSPGQVSPVFETSFGFHIMKLDRVQAGEFKPRHILIRPEVDSADIERARQLADSVATALRGGASFDQLAARYHDPVEDRVIPEIPQSQLPEAYQSAIRDRKMNDIADPFPIENPSRGAPKFVVLQITSIGEEHTPTLEDFDEQIRQQLQQERAFLRLIENLRRQMYVAVKM